MFSQLKKEIADRLVSFGVEPHEASREAELIVQHVSGLSLVEQIKADRKELSASEKIRLDEILKRRSAREPLQYILGYTMFRHLKMACRAGVFIPRSDTETVVAAALALLPSPANVQVAALELGPGAGTICVSLLHERQDLRVTAVEISEKACALTEENARAHGVASRLTLINEDIENVLATPAERFSLIVSNPPYISPVHRQSLQPEVGRWEPEQALFGGDADGLATYRMLARQAAASLLHGGFMVVEVGDGQADAVVDIFETFDWDTLCTYKDVHGLTRAVSARAPK